MTSRPAYEPALLGSKVTSMDADAPAAMVNGPLSATLNDECEVPVTASSRTCRSVAPVFSMSSVIVTGVPSVVAPKSTFVATSSSGAATLGAVTGCSTPAFGTATEGTSAAAGAASAAGSVAGKSASGALAACAAEASI